MNRTPVVSPRRSRQRGQALAFVGIGMIVFTGMMVVGVDVARLAFTAAEVQSIADTAAMAAAAAHAKGSADPQAEAVTVIQQNYVDGQIGSLGSNPSDVVKSLTPGQWNFTNGTFTALTWGDPLVNAVRASATARVDNLVAAAIGVAQSDVTREATAAAAGACSETLALPVAIEMDAIQSMLDADNCRDMETSFFQVPSDNSCFTSLSEEAAGADEERSHIPTECDGQGANDGGGEFVAVGIGDPIRLNNGALSSVLKTIEGCLTADPPLREFVVPVIPAGSCDPSLDGTTQPVQTFARIWIESVTDTTSDKHILVKGVCREVVTGSNPGCNTGGELALAIVK